MIQDTKSNWVDDIWRMEDERYIKQILKSTNRKGEVM